MREVAELRIREEFASMLLSDTEGERLGNSIRKFEIETSDRRFGEVGRLQRELRSRQGTSLFSGWQLRRSYSKDDIAGTKMFQVRVRAAFEPAGEECGTKYDESTACPKCGAGAVQVSDLFLDLRRAPKTKDIVTTIA